MERQLEKFEIGNAFVSVRKLLAPSAGADGSRELIMLSRRDRFSEDVLEACPLQAATASLNRMNGEVLIMHFVLNFLLVEMGAASLQVAYKAGLWIFNLSGMTVFTYVLMIFS